MRDFTVLLIGLLALPAQAQAQSVPRIYASGTMPVVASVDFTNYNPYYTGDDRAFECATELGRMWNMLPPNPWRFGESMFDLRISESDEREYPAATLLYCSRKNTGVAIRALYLGGSRFPSIEATALTLSDDVSGEAEKSCVARAEKLPSIEPRFTSGEPLGIEMAALFNTVVFEDRSRNLAYVIACAWGDVLLAVVGNGPLIAEREALVTAWARTKPD